MSGARESEVGERGRERGGNRERVSGEKEKNETERG